MSDAAVYSAQDAAEEIYREEFPGGYDMHNVSAGDLPAYLMAALQSAGFPFDEAPEYRLDIPDEHEWAGGYHFGPDGEYLRFHPRLLRPWIVLHELAHWLTPGNSHGPSFCGALLRLVRGTIHPEAASVLKEQFEAHGVLYSECDADGWRRFMLPVLHGPL